MSEKPNNTKSTKSTNSRKWITWVCYLLGFLLLCYPLISGIVQRQHQRNAVATYQSSLGSKSKEDIVQILKDADEYNSMLFQSNGAIVNNMNTSILSDESYKSLLNQSSQGVMGSIEIPKIDVDLPIYHGTSDEVLSNGIGHQQGTSLPVGGENTHCVLTGHRGLPGSKLFTRLDEIEEGDLFFISTMGSTLAYRVYKIEVVEPDNVDVMRIDSGKDEISLVTCTPYGLNTHRLVVTGERVPYEKANYDSIKAELPSWRELAFAALPFVLMGIIIVSKIRDWRKRKHEKEKV